MQRHSGLQSLSREHHAALSLGRALQAGPDGDFDGGLPVEPGARVAEVRARFERELLPHFAAEERELLPLSDCGDAALRAHADTIRAQHAEIRRLLAALGEGDPQALGPQLGEKLTAHVRFEERTWFPALEAGCADGDLNALERRLQTPPRALIAGYHQDDVGDWVAELDCGHGQHMRHRPPFQVAEWVTTAAGRADRIGSEVPCALCRMPRMPACAEVYKSTPVYSAADVPAGLLKTHDLKAGTWGRIEVLAGNVAYVLEDEGDLTLILRPGVDGVVAPQRPHHIEPTADARLRVAFLRVPPSTLRC